MGAERKPRVVWQGLVGLSDGVLRLPVVTAGTDASSFRVGGRGQRLVGLVIGLLMSAARLV